MRIVPFRDNSDNIPNSAYEFKNQGHLHENRVYTLVNSFSPARYFPLAGIFFSSGLSEMMINWGE